MVLSPLREDEVRRLAAHLLGVPRISREFAASLHELTEGIPFAIEETLHALPTDLPLSKTMLANLEPPIPLREQWPNSVCTSAPCAHCPK
jgi:hypothetical protein